MGKGALKGITLEIGGETSPLAKSLEGVNKTSKDLQTELKAVNGLLKFDPKNTVALEQKQKLLSASINNTKDKLGSLKEAERQAQAQFKKGEISEQQYRELQREVVKTEQNLKGLETQARKANAVLSKDEATANLKKIGKAVGVAALAAGAAFVGVGVAAVKSAGELQKFSDQTGFTAERIQELAYVGQQIDMDFETLIKSQTKLTRGMAQAKDGNKAQANSFKELGIEILGSDGKLRDSKVVMLEVIDALGGMKNETERDAVSLRIFGKSALELNPLIKAGSSEIAKFSAAARNSGAVMSNEAVAGLDAFGDTIESLKTSVLGGVGTALAGLMPQIQAVIDKMIELPQWIRDNSTMLTIIGVAIGVVTALIVAFNIQQLLLASGMTLWSAIAGVGTAITTGLGTAFVFLTSPIALVILAIGALIATGVLLYKNWDTVSAFLTTIWNSIATTATNVWNGIGTFFSNLWTGITVTTQSVWNGIKDFFSTVWNGIATVVMAIVNPFIAGITYLFNSMKTGLDTIMQGLRMAFGGVWDVIKNIFLGAVLLILDLVTGNFTKLKSDAESIFNNLKAAFSQIWNGIKLIFTGAVQAISAFLKTAWNGIKTTATTICNALKTTIITIWDGLMTWFRGLPGKLQTIGSNMMNGLKNGISSMMSTIKSVIINGINNSTSFITSLPGKAFQWGKDFINGLKNGIMSAINGIANAVKNIAGTIRSYLHFSTPDEGPLADYEKWMPDFMGGLAKGIEDSKYKVANAIKGLSTDVNIGMNLTPAMAGVGSSASQGSVKQGDTNINFNGSYSFADNNSIDYFMNKAAVLVQRRQG